MTENCSVTTVVVGDRLPWPDDAGTAVAKGPFDASANCSKNDTNSDADADTGIQADPSSARVEVA